MVDMVNLDLFFLSSEAVGVKILLIVFSLFIGFHVLVLLGIIPYKIVWGGRIKNKSQLWVMELVSILILLLCLFVLFLKLEWIIFSGSTTIATIGLWLLLGVFTLNTLGNLMAKTNIEKYLFGSLTFVISLLILGIQLNLI